jgi:hypothetical protein
MLLSVVVVNWNSIADLRECLSSLAAQRHRELEIIVVDNGSTDGSVSMVEREFPGASLIATGENLGFAEACNIGIEASRGAWVCMLNNDATADAGWAEAMARAAEAVDGDCGMLQSLMLYKSRPGIINSTGIEMNARGVGRDRYEGLPRSRGGAPAEIFCVTAGAAAYRRSMLDALRTEDGYFDRRHFMYYEDLDLGWRARLAGFTARYVPDAVVYHVWHGSSDRHGKDWLRRLAGTNRLRALLKNASWQTLLGAGPTAAGIVIVLLWLDGLKAVRDLREVVTVSLRARRAVEAMRRRDRREVERRWITR